MINGKIFSQNLLRWYAKHKRDLPWRRTKDPHKIWISEVMLQQTTVNTVIPYYDKWIKEFPDVNSLAQAPLQKLLKMWQGLGYYNRVRNMAKAAGIICTAHQGKFPDTYEHLRKLPGFGPYTTGAVLSIAFGKKHPIVDANVRRVFMRILAIKEEFSPKVDQQIEEILLEILPSKHIGDFNQALMELGALVCRSKQPLCLACPVKKFCRAYQKGIQEIIPSMRKKNIKHVHAVIALMIKNKKFFIQKRPSKGLLADMWEFPGGKVNVKESADQALIREVKEETSCVVTDSKYIGTVVHFYTEFKVKLDVYTVLLGSWPKTDDTHKWVSLKALENFPLPSGSAKIVDLICSKLPL